MNSQKQLDMNQENKPQKSSWTSPEIVTLNASQTAQLLPPTPDNPAPS